MNNNTPKTLLNPAILNLIGKRLGFSNGIPQQYVNLATTLLLSGVANKMNNKETADDTFNYVKQEQNQKATGLLDNIFDFVKGAIGGEKTPESNQQQAESKGGSDLNQIFGSQLDGIVRAFAQATGLEEQKAKKLLLILAPIILAYVANKIKFGKDSKEAVAKDVMEDYRNPERTVQSENDGGLLGALLNRKDDRMMDDAVGILRTLLFK